MANRPRPISYEYEKGKEFELASVHEDWYAEQFADPGDIQCTRAPVIDGDIHLFDGDTYAVQAKKAEMLGKWLLKYAAWIKTKKHKEDPYG